MIIPVRVDDKVDTVIIGYAPGKDGNPLVIVPWATPDGGYVPYAVRLDQCRFVKLPKEIRRRLSGNIPLPAPTGAEG